ncbi:BrnA antitoxin family protein [Jannaschia donghaensis]|uniref:BrnA antitoxin of type II toxin-antitoxin system n=1 Tax=Jannaschia donghaensis TaxID=420998 RepID=A0A0M6YEI3_9RHOB|nr:BrnA antitoxin family protein [Jannaschia donghaensis]CTQ48761.1 hypothetical protein JDO7802_00766 [Jannaschia donghaensis]
MTTKTQRDRRSEMVGMMTRFQWDLAHAATRDAMVPEAWREVYEKRSSKKRKVSLYLDEDVYKLFKSMGAGMGPRMNVVLGAFARARLAGLLDGEDLVEEARESWMGVPKPSMEELRVLLEKVEAGKR